MDVVAVVTVNCEEIGVARGGFCDKTTGGVSVDLPSSRLVGCVDFVGLFAVQEWCWILVFGCFGGGVCTM
jgi:hypothetical protein